MATQEAKAVDSRLRDEQGRYAPNAVNPGLSDTNVGRNGAAVADVPLRQQGAVDEQFATEELETQSDRDVAMNDKLKAQTAPGVTPFGQLIASDEDFAWLRGKREAEAYANFQAWFAQNFDHMSPTEKAIARKLFPSFYEERVRHANKLIDLQRKQVELKIKGIETKEDLLFQYALESGMLPTDAVENILHPEKVRAARTQAMRQAQYGRGLLNPKRLIRGDFGDATRDVNAQQALGRNAGAFGAEPAYTLGTRTGAPAQDHGFSSAGFTTALGGPLDGVAERVSGYSDQSAYLQSLLA